MDMDGTRLYAALPAYLREADELNGSSVRALFDIMGGESERLARAIDQLGESWFIETCPEWAVPYIADLLAVQALTPTAGFSERVWVADTIALRRRKGTLAVVGTLARATTGWPSLPVEMFRRLATTQSMRHVRRDAAATAPVRAPETMRRHDSAFDMLPHTLDVRSIARGQGRYNVPNIGIFAWRAQAYPLDAVECAPGGAGRFWCDPAGRDLSLWNAARTQPQGAIPHEADMPTMLDRRTLWLELEDVRGAIAAGRTPTPRWFGGQPPLRIWVQQTAGAAFTEILPEAITSADLHDVADARGWRRPPASRSYIDANGAAVSQPITVAFDPVRGRIAFPDGVAPVAVWCSHALAMPGDLGGGPYDRADAVAGALGGRAINWQVGVSRRRTPVPNVIFATVAEAVAEWNAQPPGTVGAIALLDNDRFGESLTGTRSVVMKRGSLLLLLSADWPPTPREGGGSDLLPGSLSPRGRRAAIVGDVEVRGSAAASAIDPGVLAIDGVLVSGSINVTPTGGGNLGGLMLSNTTVLGAAGISVTGLHERLTIALTRTVTGPIVAPDSVPGLVLTESVVLGAVTMPGARTTFSGGTVTGATRVRSVSASDTLFAQAITSTRKQIGCLRYSLVPPGSAGPRQFRCQPQLAIDEGGAGADVAAIAARLGLAFDSTDPGAAAFARLGWRCDPGLVAGAENGGAMGVWRFLEEPQRRANLAIALDEYLGLGLEAGLIPAS